MTSIPIVAAIDGSLESILAVEWAAREARLRAAPLRIVSAVESGSVTYSDNRDQQLAVAAEAAAAMAPGLLIDTDPVDGPPAQAVTGSGAGALMLVTGSRGTSAFSGMLLGSVSRYAALHAPCPVVVVREETMAAHRQVVVGIRRPDDCDAALGFAFEEAALRNATLLAVHAWQAPRAAYPPLPEARSHAAGTQAAQELEELLDDWQQKYPAVITRQDVMRGHPGRVLAGLSARADLVVIGRRSHRAGPGPARIVHAVLSHAHGPVVTVPSP